MSEDWVFCARLEAMSAVSLLSTLKEKPTDDSQKDKVNQSGK